MKAHKLHEDRVVRGDNQRNIWHHRFPTDRSGALKMACQSHKAGGANKRQEQFCLQPVKGTKTGRTQFCGATVARKDTWNHSGGENGGQRPHKHPCSCDACCEMGQPSPPPRWSIYNTNAFISLPVCPAAILRAFPFSQYRRKPTFTKTCRRTKYSLSWNSDVWDNCAREKVLTWILLLEDWIPSDRRWRSLNHRHVKGS